MSDFTPPEFDRYASRYEADLRQSIPSFLAEDEYFTEYKIRHVARRIGNRELTRCLDFGCGIGLSLGLLRQRFPTAEFWGYDVSSRSVDLARERAGTSILTSNLDDLPASGFDMIFAANVFHHIPRVAREDALARCKRLLRQSGVLFLFEHNPLNPITRLVFERCPYDEGAVMLHRREVFRLVEAVGLQIIHSDYTLFFPRQLAFLRPVERMLGWLPSGAQYCVEMVK